MITVYKPVTAFFAVLKPETKLPEMAPMANNTGPAAAAIPPNTTIKPFVASDVLPIAESIPFSAFTTLLTNGNMTCPNCVPTSFKDSPSIRIWLATPPPVLSKSPCALAVDFITYW